MERVKAKVLRIDKDSHKFVVEYQDHQYKINQLKFQQQQRETPEYIDCMYERRPDDRAYLRQDIESLVRGKYKEDDIIELKVKHIFDNYISLEDENGFAATMSRNSEVKELLTTRILGRITKIGSLYMQVSFAKAVHANRVNLPELEESLRNDNTGSSVIDRVAAIVNGDIVPYQEHLRCHWLVNDVRNTPVVLSHLIDGIYDIFGKSDLLTRCTFPEREKIEHRLSAIVDQTHWCTNAAKAITNNEAEDTVMRMAERISQSGYCYRLEEKLYTTLFICHLEPALTTKIITLLLSALRKQDIKVWQRDPYAGVWVTLLQQYIDYIGTTQEQYAIGDEEKRLLIQVIAMQSAIDPTGRLGIIDTRLNKAILFRLCSEMKVEDRQKMLEQALLSLISETSSATFVYNEGSEDVDITANIIYHQKDTDETDETIPEVYSTDQVDVSVTANAITIAPTTTGRERSYMALHNLNLFHHLDIRLDEKPRTAAPGNASSSIGASKNLWHAIDKSLYSNHTSTQTKNKRPVVGDAYDIIITAKTPNIEQEYECRIVEDGYEGEGTLLLSETVGYYPGDIGTANFRHNGRPLKLYATVTDIREDGKCTFSMAENIIDFTEEYHENNIQYNTEMVCSLNNRKGNVPRTPGISTDGFSMSIEAGNGATLADLTKGKLVVVGDIKMGPDGYLNATYLRDADPTEFTTQRAFHNLMVLYAYGEVYTENEQNEEESQKAFMQESHVAELTNIIDVVASTENDHVRRYNYLAYCRLLAKILQKDSLEKYYELRMLMTEALKYFEKNRKVDPEHIAELNKWGDIITHRNLSTTYDKLTILQMLNTDNAERLFDYVRDSKDESVKGLASLVASHNLIKKMGLQEQAGDIMEKIFETLGLRWTESNKKYYGREDFHTEFKQSIVYPAGAMREDINTQTSVILKVICSFLNSDGGKLYIGVNDTGYEMGIENDLKYRLFEGNLDKYERHIVDAVTIRLGQEASHHVHYELDKGAKTKVLVVNVERCHSAVSLDGIYYERFAETSRALHEPYLSKFLAARTKSATSSSTPPATVKETTTCHPQKQENDTITKDPEQEHTIATSTYRNNAIHDYDEGYILTIGYICLCKNNTYSIHHDEDWNTYDLQLAVHENEVNGWLVMVYRDGYISKVPVKELLDKDDNATYKRFADAEIVFASIVTDTDTLAIGVGDSKGNRYMRFDDVKNVIEDKMQGHGISTISTPHNGVYYCDTLPIATVQETSLKRNLNDKQLGVSLKTNYGQDIRKLLPKIGY